MKKPNSRSNPSQEWHEPYFTPAPPRMLDVPVNGRIEISDRFPPRVRFAGTLWRFKVCDTQPACLNDRQIVTIIGRQGNCLLIVINPDQDER